MSTLMRYFERKRLRTEDTHPDRRFAELDAARWSGRSPAGEPFDELSRSGRVKVDSLRLTSPRCCAPELTTSDDAFGSPQMT
jgi:hypothetical protein